VPVLSHLPLAAKHAFLELERLLPSLEDGSAGQDRVLYFCTCCRRLAASSLFLTGLPDGFVGALAKSGRAFQAFLERTNDAAKLTSKSAPLLDALAAADWSAARSIAAASRTTWNEGAEYPEDFHRYRVLMALVAADADLGSRLEAWADVHDGDPRLALCTALANREQADFDEALAGLVTAEEESSTARFLADKLDPDTAVTTARVSVEGVAFVRLAVRLGLSAPADLPLVPSNAFAATSTPLPAPDAWKDLGGVAP
jgi:hypothetical protein